MEISNLGVNPALLFLETENGGYYDFIRELRSWHVVVGISPFFNSVTASV